MTQARLPAGETGSILVIVTRQLGDVLLTTPLVRAARRRWPQAHIDVLGFSGTLGLLRGNPDVRELIEVPPGSGWRQSWPLIKRLWKRYDLALIAQYTDRAHLYGWVAARTRAGHVPAGRQSWWKRRLLAHAVELGADQSHVVLEKLKLLAPWTDLPASVSVQPPPAAALPRGIEQQLRPRYVVLQVPSLVAYKQWPLAHYAQTVQGLVDHGFQAVLTGGPSEADRRAVATVRDQSGVADGDAPQAPWVVDAAGQLDLNQVVTLLAGAALYIGPDTSITHLAAACGVPTIAMFGPIDPRLWGPWPGAWPSRQPYVPHDERQPRGNVILLQGPQPCVPCNGEGCDKHRGSRSQCLETMSAQRVLDEALAVLGVA